MGATRAGLKRWPLKPSERAAMRAAQERVAAMLSAGVSDQDKAQARAALRRMDEPRQPQLALKVPHG